MRVCVTKTGCDEGGEFVVLVVVVVVNDDDDGGGCFLPRVASISHQLPVS